MAEPSWRHGWAYGALGFPLAFVSLPLYVSLPHYYASTFGLSLALLGSVLLFTRLLDALIDPVLGQWLDRLFARGLNRVWASLAVAGGLLLVGMAALWWPIQAVTTSSDTLVVWLALALMVTYAGFSWTTIGHQAWGARWGGHAVQRARWVAWREGAALFGVIAASVLPSVAGQAVSYQVMVTALVLALLGLGATRHLSLPTQWPAIDEGKAYGNVVQPAGSLWLPWRTKGFPILYLVFSLNGIASAVPATLLLFFVDDVLGASQWQSLFLGAYFVAAALGMPFWVWVVRRYGLVPAWLMGMALSILAFCGTPLLQAGQAGLFLAVCIASGWALGADLVVPGALLTGIVAKVKNQGPAESRFFAWWALAGKLNLALAAGITLPVLGWLGYSAGTTQASVLLALSLAYGLVPCLLKLLAFGLLFWCKATHRLHEDSADSVGTVPTTQP